MGHYYFDSSALIKKYVFEKGTAWINALCSTNAGQRTTFSLSPVTFVCADEQLNIAALAEGLVVENPNSY